MLLLQTVAATAYFRMRGGMPLADSKNICRRVSEPLLPQRIGAYTPPMTSPSASPEHASTAEVIEALEGLSREDQFRLRQLALLRSSALVVMDWEDLLSEAVKRALEGTRLWPKGVPFLAFMAQTMRSIASEERREAAANLTVAEGDLAWDAANTSPLAELSSTDIHPAREVEAKQLLRSIERLFKDDPSALAVLHGFAMGSSPEEIQADSDLTPTQYASTQRRIRRALTRL